MSFLQKKLLVFKFPQRMMRQLVILNMKMSGLAQLMKRKNFYFQIIHEKIIFCLEELTMSQ